MLSRVKRAGTLKTCAGQEAGRKQHKESGVTREMIIKLVYRGFPEIKKEKD